MKNTWVGLLAWAVAVAGACAGGGHDGGPAPYVIEVKLETFEAKKSQSKTATGTERVERDTVQASSTLDAYSKGVQKYAATLLDVHRNGRETRSDAGELAVFDHEGADIVGALSQTQRDSIVMNFIHFARRATIPYHEHVKDFELKVMAVR